MRSPNQRASRGLETRDIKSIVSYGSREKGAAGKTNVAALKEAGVSSVYYESPNTAHEWQTWRRSLHGFAPLLFKDH